MSVQTISWVLEHSRSKGNERCVMIALANRFDAKEPWRCWPSLKTIAAEANVSRSTLIRSLHKLVADGELLVYANQGGGEATRGDRRPNLYVMPALTDWRPDEVSDWHPVGEPRGVTADTSEEGHGVSDQTPRGVKTGLHGVSLLTPDTNTDPLDLDPTKQNPPYPPSGEIPSGTDLVPVASSPSATASANELLAAKLVGSDQDESFLAFYDAYPRHVGKGQARKAWRAAVLTKRESPDMLVMAARLYAQRREGEDPQFTPYPSSWLNGERWIDEPDRECYTQPAADPSSLDAETARAAAAAEIEATAKRLDAPAVRDPMPAGLTREGRRSA